MIDRLLLVFILLISVSANAQYYDTLPKGVNLISFRSIKSNVESSYNRTQSETPYNFEIDANIKTLEKIDNEIVQDILEVFKPYPEAYKNLSLGSHKIDAKADINVDVYATAYGITDRVSAYIGIPIFNAKVDVNYTKKNDNSKEKVSEILQKQYGDDWAQTLGNIVENMNKLNLDENIIQSGLVNIFGYEELGGWSGKGLGDIEFGVMYNFLRSENYGIMATFGGVAPTGYVDDPDILQDIGFGDGQWDAFLELGGGYILSNSIILNTWGRYTYQIESHKNLRAPYTQETDLSDKTIKFKEKLGNNMKLGFDTEIFLSDWLKVQPGYVYSYTEKAVYTSDDNLANEILSKDSESSSQSFKVLAQLSSVKLFQQKKFFLPAQINFSFSKMLDGKNTPKVDVSELELRMFF